MTSFRSVSHDASGLPATANGQRQWRFGYSAAPVVSNTYATWNAADSSPNISLLDADLSLTHVGPGWDSIRATQGKTEGKHYFEISMVATGGSNAIIGVGTASAGLLAFAGADAHAWTYFAFNGNKINNGSLTAYGSAAFDPDVIGVAVDLDGMTVTFYINGVSQGAISIAGLSGAVFPIASCYTSQAGVAQTTANFGASAFAYAPPVGFNAGWYV